MQASVFLHAKTELSFQQTVEFYTALSFVVIKRSEFSNEQTEDEKYEETLDALFNQRTLNISLADLASMKTKLSLTHTLTTSGEFTYLKDPLNTLISISQRDVSLVTPPSLSSPSLASPSLAPSADTTPLPIPITILKSGVSLSTSHTPLKTPKRCIGILTSGGDSSGMNAAVRAVCRYALQRRQCQPFAIFEGYNGLVEGGDKIKELGWEDVRGLLSMGGTVIGSARSTTFRTHEGRLSAALNLIHAQIDALVIIGGDGSLTGADLLRQEWPTLLQELHSTSRINLTLVPDRIKSLTIVGLVGSIDNDMCMTGKYEMKDLMVDMTIGAATSLHRICESLDSLTSTALSHQRAFVVEVMGRYCGWLALMAAIAVGADWVFLPERPPPLDAPRYDSWEQEMCDTLATQKTLGSRAILVIVAEGAIDKHLKPIKAEYVKSVIEERLGYDTRVTNLGHVQRGGKPCAFDRCLATLQGIEAVKALLSSTPTTPSPMITLSNNKTTSVSLKEAVALTQSVSQAIAKKDFKTAMELRDPDFKGAYDAYIESTLSSHSLNRLLPPQDVSLNIVADNGKVLRVGILHMGAPAGGMNAATRTAARLCLNRGHTPLGIHNGFSGLVRDEVFPITWRDVNGWQTKGGSQLGTNRDHPDPSTSGIALDPFIHTYVSLGLIAYHLQKHNIQSLLILGGFEAFTSLSCLHRARATYPAFCIPMVHLPCTISNNIPGVDASVGCDTASNVIVDACDAIKQSANASRSRVFVVEVQGGECGYLAAMAGFICGAATTYIPERGITLDMLQADLRHLCRRYEDERRLKIPHEGRIILRTETAGGATYTTDVICNILKAEGKGLFDSRTTILGHLQQGGIPSPLDRIKATRLAVKCIDWLQLTARTSRLTSSSTTLNGGAPNAPEIYTTGSESCCVVGIRGAKIAITPIEELMEETDFGNRRGREQWWMELMDLTKILAKYEFFSD